MRKLSGAAAFLTMLLLSSACLAARISDFRFLAQIRQGAASGSPVGLKVSPEVLGRSSIGGADIRIFDDKGVEVPYVMYALTAPSPSLLTWKIDGYSNDEGVQTLILVSKDTGGFIQDLTISTSAQDFNKSIEVSVPSDDSGWKPVASDLVYDFTSQVNLSKTTVEFPPIRAAKVRVVLRDASPAPQDRDAAISLRYKDLSFRVEGRTRGEIPVHGVTSKLCREAAAARQFDEYIIENSSTFMDKEGNTVIDLGRVNFPVERMVLKTQGSYYFRKVELHVSETGIKDTYKLASQGEVFRIPGIRDRNDVLDIHHGRQTPYMRLKVINRDNPPLGITGIALQWKPRSLYFIPEAGRSYTLYFGSDTAASPQYETARIIPYAYEKLIAYEKWTCSQARENETYRKPADEAGVNVFEDYAFKAVMVLLVLLLGFWLFHLMKKIPGTPSS